MTVYKFVELLSMRQYHPNPEIPAPEIEKIKEYLKQFHIILKIDPSWHTELSEQKEVFIMKVHNEIIMLSTKTQKFGISTFQIESDLTPDATSEEIESEIRRFNSSMYKDDSKFIYQQMITNPHNAFKIKHPTTTPQKEPNE